MSHLYYAYENSIYTSVTYTYMCSVMTNPYTVIMKQTDMGRILHIYVFTYLLIANLFIKTLTRKNSVH